MNCKCKTIGKCEVRTDYNGLDPHKMVEAVKMSTPGGSIYYRVFFDPKHKKLFYNIPESDILAVHNQE